MSKRKTKARSALIVLIICTLCLSACQNSGNTGQSGAGETKRETSSSQPIPTQSTAGSDQTAEAKSKTGPPETSTADASKQEKPQLQVIDPVQWHDQYYLSMEDDFFKTVDVKKEDCVTEESERSILYTLPGKYYVYNEECQAHMATIYSEVRNLGFTYEFHDGLQRPFDLFKTIIAEMDRFYERQGTTEESALDTCKDVEAFSKVCNEELNMFGIVWVLDDDEWVMLEVRTSGEESYVALTFKYNSTTGERENSLFGQAYDSQTLEPLDEITSVNLQKSGEEIILNFYYDKTYYYFSFDAASGETMEKGIKYQTEATLDDGTNCIAVLITDDALSSASGLVRCYEGEMGSSSFDLQFGYLLSDSRDTLKDWLTHMDDFLGQIEPET